MNTNSHPLHLSPAAAPYARSLLELANERGQAVEVGEEMRGIGQIIADNPQFKEFLANPSVAAAERTRVVDSVFGGQVSELVFNLIRVATRKNRAGIIDQIAGAYLKLLDEQLGNVDVDVTSAKELDNDQRQEIGLKIGQILGKTPILHHFVDDSIIGGLVVKVGDKLLDASVKSQLSAMREKMLLAK